MACELRLSLALAARGLGVEPGIFFGDGAALLFERAAQGFGLLRLALDAAQVLRGGERPVVNARARRVDDFIGKPEPARDFEAGGGAGDADEQAVGRLQSALVELDARVRDALLVRRVHLQPAVMRRRDDVRAEI